MSYCNFHTVGWDQRTPHRKLYTCDTHTQHLWSETGYPRMCADPDRYIPDIDFEIEGIKCP